MKLSEMTMPRLRIERQNHKEVLGQLEILGKTTAPITVGNLNATLSYADESKAQLIERLAAYSSETIAEIERLLGE